MCENVAVLTTARLLLRPVAPADKEALFRILLDRQVTEILCIWRPLEDAARFWERAMNGRTALPDWDYVIHSIVEQETERILGYVEFGRLPDEAGDRIANIAYILDPAFWNRGFATEAVAPFVQFGFERLKLNVIRTWVDTINVASRRVLEKNDFRLTGNHWEGCDGDGIPIPDEIEYERRGLSALDATPI